MMSVNPVNAIPTDRDPPVGKERGPRPRLAIIAAIAAVVLLLLSIVLPGWFIAEQQEKPCLILLFGPADGAACKPDFRCVDLEYDAHWLYGSVSSTPEVLGFKRFFAMGIMTVVTSVLTMVLLSVALVAMITRRRRPRLAEALRAAVILVAIFGTATFTERPAPPWLHGFRPAEGEVTVSMGPGFPLLLAGALAALMAAAGLAGSRRKVWPPPSARLENDRPTM